MPRLRDDGLKECSRCRNDSPAENYYFHPETADHLGSACRDCVNATTRARRDDPVIRRRTKNTTLLRKYGISIDVYDRMFAEQDGKCAGCGEAGGPKPLAVDHCHSTLAVRWLLCQKCNVGLGSFNDDPTLLRKLASMLEEFDNAHKWQQTVRAA